MPNAKDLTNIDHSPNTKGLGQSKTHNDNDFIHTSHQPIHT